MARQDFNANGIVYTVSPEPALAPGLRTWAVLEARLLDEITGVAPEGQVSVSTLFSGISPRVAPGGMVGFAGIPVRAFPELMNTGYVVPVNIDAAGYIPIERNVNVAQNAAFPASFAPTDMGTLQLHRTPTIIAGRVVLNTGIALQPIAGATVTLKGLWRTPPPANLVVPADAPDLISLVPDLYYDRVSAGSQLQGLNFLGVPGPDKLLQKDSPAAQSQLFLSDRLNIAVGDVLAIDTGDAARTEYVAIQAIAGASTADQPATITLVSPLRIVHRQGAVVHKVQFQNVGAVTPLKQDAATGDFCLFVNGVANLASAPLLSVQGGANPVEYHAVSYFEATSDARGFFRWPPISRVAQCEMLVHDGVHADLDVDYQPDYENEESHIDFVYQ